MNFFRPGGYYVRDDGTLVLRPGYFGPSAKHYRRYREKLAEAQSYVKETSDALALRKA